MVDEIRFVKTCSQKWRPPLTEKKKSGYPLHCSVFGEVLCWTLLSLARRGWWGMWSSRAAAETMEWQSSRPLGKWVWHTSSILPCTSGEQTLQGAVCQSAVGWELEGRGAQKIKDCLLQFRSNEFQWGESQIKLPGACVDERGASGWNQTQEEGYRGQRKGQVVGRNTETSSRQSGKMMEKIKER